MKPLNIAKEYEEFEELELRRGQIAFNVQQQISVVERIIENNAKYCQSTLTWNVVSGLLEQLKTYGPAIFITAEDSLYKAMKEDVEAVRMKPLYGENT